MATPEKRTLSIFARLVDGVSAPAGVIGKSLTAFGRTSGAIFGAAGKAVFSLKSAVVGLAGAYVGLAGVAKLRAIAESADALVKLADATGDTVENMSELRGALELGGVKAEQFAEVLQLVGKQAKLADKGNEQVARTFRQLGITLQDLSQLGPSQLFERISVGLERFSTEQEKALVLSRLLPSQYLQLLPVLGKGSAAFRDAVIEARTAGATVTRAEAEASEALNDSITRLQFSLAKTGRSIIEAFGPSVRVLLDDLTKAIGKNRDEIVKVAGAIGGGIVSAVGLGIDAIIELVRLIEKIPGVDLLDKSQIDAQIRSVESEFRAAKARLDADRIDNPYLPDSDDVRRLRAKLAELEAIRSQGLASMLKREQEIIRKQLRAVAGEGLPEVSATGDPERTAAALGIPSPEQVGEWGAAMKRAFADANPGDLTSVFQTPTNKGIDIGVDSRTFDDIATGAKRLVGELARVSPGLEGVHDRLLQIDRDADVLALEDAARAGVLSAEELAAALAGVERKFDDIKRKALQAQQTFSGGLKRSIEGLRDSMVNFGETAGVALGNLVTSGVDGLGDAIGDVIAGTKSAKEAFRDFARQFLIDVARMIGKLLVLSAVKTVLGLEDGGVVIGGVQDTMPVQGFARGGIARQPTLAVFGEGKKAEAFVPLPDNRTIPVTLTGNGGGGGNVYQFNITAMDGKDVQRVLIEQQSTLRAIFENQITTRVGMRQVIQRTA